MNRGIIQAATVPASIGIVNMLTMAPTSSLLDEHSILHSDVLLSGAHPRQT
jgi:hypothetical protein